MKINLLPMAILLFGLSACGAPATPMLEQTISPTAISMSTNTPLPVIPTATSISLVTQPASPTPLLFTDPSIPLSERIVYYYFVTPVEIPIPEGSVTISSTYILAPTFSDITYSSDTADNLRTALEAVLNDSRNGWISDKLEISILLLTTFMQTWFYRVSILV